MASSPHFGTEPVYVDPQSYPQGVVRIRLEGDTNDRVRILLDGSVLAGNGTDEPEDVVPADLADTLADFEDRITTLEGA